MCSCSAAVALNPIRAGDVPTLCIMNTYTQAWHLGHTVLQARHDKQDPIEAILEHEKGSRILIKGKVSYRPEIFFCKGKGQNSQNFLRQIKIFLLL